MWKIVCWMFYVNISILYLDALSDIDIYLLGSYHNGVYDESAAEIVAHDPCTQRLYVVNANALSIDVLNISNPYTPTSHLQIDITPYGAGATSVAFLKGILAVTVESDPKQAPGKVVFFNADGEFQNAINVGALPDMLTFTPDGHYLLVANEGEPDGYCILSKNNDPEGSISIIDLKNGISHLTQNDVQTADFQMFTRETIHPQVRIFGPGATVAQDLEPEYITVSPDSSIAWIALQENNAIAVLDIPNATIIDIFPLGYKDYAKGGGLDASDKDAGINITNWPFHGMYQPDAIAAYKVGSKTYLITANEGDARNYECFSETVRVEDLMLNPKTFADPQTLQQPENLGRLKITTAMGDTDNDGIHEAIFSYGARSFSIWDVEGNLIYDSDSDFEMRTAELFPNNFNSDESENDSFDTASPKKGPEPEGLTIGQIGDRIYAFIGFESVGGIAIYDVSNPFQPQFVQYVNNRDFHGDPEKGTAGDLGPEGILFINEADSPIEYPLLVVGNEVSGTTTIYAIRELDISVEFEPKTSMLLQNYPNPFNPETWIPYQLAAPADVTMTIYTLDGKIARNLALGYKPVGIYQNKSCAAYWDGKNDVGEAVASGVYFYTLTAGEFTATRKMLIRK